MMNRWRTWLAAAIVLMVLSAGSSDAQLFTPGDVVISGIRPSDNQGVVNLFRPDGTFATTVRSGNFNASDAAFNAAGQLHLAMGAVMVLDPMGNFVRFMQTVPGSSLVESLTFARDGRVILLSGSFRVFMYAPNDALLAQYPFADTGWGLAAIDLAADQCTLYFAGRSPSDHAALGRVNLCSGGPLEPVVLYEFPGIGIFPTALRILPSGQLLVGFHTPTGPVHLFDRSGTLVRTYATPGPNLAIAPDGRSFWAGGIGAGPVLGRRVVRVDIATGAILQTIDPGSGISSIAVVGDPRAALADTASDIPAVDPRGLAVLALLLAVAATVVVRR
jgi:hypothetical protein